ncbi:MAG: hypothetical protein AAGG38_02680 [Planctomycetota bacterium]
MGIFLTVGLGVVSGIAGSPANAGPGTDTAAGDLPTESGPPSVDEAKPSDGIEADREATAAALRLVNDAVTVQLDGRHHLLLRALRYLEDPALMPLFSGLVEADHPSLRVHGRLGRAELSLPRGLSATDIVPIEREDERHELIGAALDGGLLDRATQQALAAWEGLDTGVKLLLLTPRVASDEVTANTAEAAALARALEADRLGQRGLAALLLHELGDTRGEAVLFALLEKLDSAEAQAVCATLLETAWRHGLRRAGPWAHAVSQAQGVPPRVEMLARRLAIRFGAEGAEAGWSSAFAEADNATQTTRLALVGLEAAPWIGADPLLRVAEHDEVLIQRLGQAAWSVSVSRAEAAPSAAERDALELAFSALVETGHPRACRWAADYAEETGSARLAMTVVTRTEPGEPRGRARRMDAVAAATQTLIVLDPETAATALPAALSRAEADPVWQRAVLLGMIRSRSPAVQRIAAELPTFLERRTQGVALVLKTRFPLPLSGAERRAFEWAVRGGAELDDSLRVQIAWAYLKRTGQAEGAVAAVLAPANPDP